MENEHKNSDLGAPPRVGMAGKLLSVAAGAAAGVGAMVATVNHQIRSTVARAGESGFKRLKQFEKEFPDQVDSYEMTEQMIASERQAAKRFAASAMEDAIGNEGFKTAFSAMGKNETLLSKARRLAREQSPASARRDRDILESLEASGVEQGSVIAKKDVAKIIVNDEALNLKTMIENITSHIPLKDKLVLSKDLHLTSGQKSAATLAFVGVAAVTAGAVHYLMKQHAKNRQLQSNEMSQLGFNV